MTAIMRYGNFDIVSQNPNIRSGSTKRFAEEHFLPILVSAWSEIEHATGYRWKSTSYWRDSPSHQHGVSLDLAPDFTPEAAKRYAFARMSDPVLYKRTKLIRRLQRCALDFPDYGVMVGVFIEPDHLHVQLLKPDGKGIHMRIVKWKVPKGIYSDTYERMKLPML